MQTKVTLIISLPKDLERLVTKQNQEMFKEFGQYRLTGSTDGKYRNIPHITLVSMGYCFENKKQIIQEMQQIANKHKTIKIEAPKVTLFNRKNVSHLVLSVTKTNSLQKLHNDLFNSVKDLTTEKPEYCLEKFKPHITLIAYLPKDKALKAKKQVKLKRIKFTATEIAMKITQPNGKNTILKRFKLKKLTK